MASVEHEDNLLNTRTGIFLAINTILIAAIGKEGFVVPIIVEALGLLITALWLRVSLFNRKAILKTHGYKKNGKLSHPTDILAIWLPGLFLVFWVILGIIACTKQL